MKNRTKTCCHCGRETHPQPQDRNHDTGYGHCYDCLGKDAWYIPSTITLPSGAILKIWDHRDYNNGPISNDDSHAKVFEVISDKKTLYHQTLHSPKAKIIEAISSRY